MTDILMPALSPTMEEGGLAKWHVKPGDKVEAGQVIAEIETDKATMEVEAVDEGVISEILVPEGAQGVKVNTPIARLGDLGGRASAPPPTPAKAEPAKVEAPKMEAPKVEAAKNAGQRPALPDATPQPAKLNGAASGERIFASPLARRLAAEAGLDLKSVKGTGPHGRIVKADVEAAPKGTAPAAAPAGRTEEPRRQVSLEQMGIAPGSYELIPLDGMRRTVAKRMTESFRDVPHFPLSIDLEIDRLLDARSRVNTALESLGVKASVNDFVIKAAAVALMKVPGANASYTPDGIAMHKHADISMAVAIEGGLITPIIRAAETKNLGQIAKESKDLAERARTRKLKPEEFQGGTFSVSNLGMFGIKSFASIINEPQGAILSVGAGEPRPVVRGGKLEIATVMTVTLTCDHRVVDGAVGAKFLGAFKALLEDPVKMLA
jgi:pyruvate dehydrogenase E2 component (dihydrolipoamide acetyltransferase)